MNLSSLCVNFMALVCIICFASSHATIQLPSTEPCSRCTPKTSRCVNLCARLGPLRSCCRLCKASHALTPCVKLYESLYSAPILQVKCSDFDHLYGLQGPGLSTCMNDCVEKNIDSDQLKCYRSGRDNIGRMFQSCCASTCFGSTSQMIVTGKNNKSSAVYGCERFQSSRPNVSYISFPHIVTPSPSPSFQPIPSLAFSIEQPPYYNAAVMRNHLRKILNDQSDPDFAAVSSSKIKLETKPVFAYKAFVGSKTKTIWTLIDLIKYKTNLSKISTKSARPDCLANKCGTRVTIYSNSSLRWIVVGKAFNLLRRKPGFSSVYETDRSKTVVKHVNRKTFVVLVPFNKLYAQEF